MIIGKGRYSRQHVLDLADVSICDIRDDDEEVDYGIQVNHKHKSFQVSWMQDGKNNIKRVDTSAFDTAFSSILRDEGYLYLYRGD